MKPLEKFSVNTMQVSTNQTVNSEDTIEYVINSKVKTVAFEPLEKRMAKDKPYLLEGLEKLKQRIGSENYKKHIDVIQNINLSGKNMLLVAGSEQLRTLILREYFTDLLEIFKVDNIRVVGGAGLAGIDAF